MKTIFVFLLCSLTSLSIAQDNNNIRFMSDPSPSPDGQKILFSYGSRHTPQESCKCSHVAHSPEQVSPVSMLHISLQVLSAGYMGWHIEPALHGQSFTSHGSPGSRSPDSLHTRLPHRATHFSPASHPTFAMGSVHSS